MNHCKRRLFVLQLQSYNQRCSLLDPLLLVPNTNELSNSLLGVRKLFADDLKIYRLLHDPATGFQIFTLWKENLMSLASGANLGT